MICPKCKKEVDDKVIVCPYCRYVVDDVVRNNRGKHILIGSSCLFAILISLLGMFVLDFNVELGSLGTIIYVLVNIMFAYMAYYHFNKVDL